MRQIALFVSALAFFASAAVAGAQVTKVGDGYLFRLHLQAGERLKYVAPVNIKGLLAGKPVKLKLKLDVHVLKMIKKIATVEGHVDTEKYQGMQLLPARTVKFKLDQRGRVFANTGTLGGFTITFPEFPVKLHRSFVAPVPVLVSGDGPGPGIGSKDATFNFVGFANVGRVQAAKLTFVVPGNYAPSGTLLISMKDGTMLSYYTRFFLNTSASKPLEISATFKRI